MSEAKQYEVKDFQLKFTPIGSPYTGILVTYAPESEPFTSEVNLYKHRSCTEYANRAFDIVD